MFNSYLKQLSFETKEYSSKHDFILCELHNLLMYLIFFNIYDSINKVLRHVFLMKCSNI